MFKFFFLLLASPSKVNEIVGKCLTNKNRRIKDKTEGIPRIFFLGFITHLLFHVIGLYTWSLKQWNALKSQCIVLPPRAITTTAKAMTIKALSVEERRVEMKRSKAHDVQYIKCAKGGPSGFTPEETDITLLVSPQFQLESVCSFNERSSIPSKKQRRKNRNKNNWIKNTNLQTIIPRDLRGPSNTATHATAAILRPMRFSQFFFRNEKRSLNECNHSLSIVI